MNKRTAITRALGAAALLTIAAGPTFSASLVVNHDSIKERVALKPVELRDGTLRTDIVNRGPTSIDSVDLIVRYDWVWNDDLEVIPPGHGPGWVEYVTVSEIIDPGEALAFEYTPQAALPNRNDGYFVPRVAIVGYAAYK